MWVDIAKVSTAGVDRERVPIVERTRLPIVGLDGQKLRLVEGITKGITK